MGATGAARAIGAESHWDLSRDQLESMWQAGQEVIECHRVLAKTGDNVVGEVLPKDREFREFDHCPAGDVYDRASHSQFYYHAHRQGEHGHFHTFLRERGMPDGTLPVPQSEMDYMTQRDDRLSHLIAISMDARGLPIALFTTNRWVTAENWYACGDVCAMLERFDVDMARPSWPTNRWIGAMLRLFRPQIMDLLIQRDAVMEDWRDRHPDQDVFEDRGLEIPSELEISVDAQMARIAEALGFPHHPR